MIAGIERMIERRPDAALETAEHGLARTPKSAHLLFVAAFLQGGVDPATALKRWSRIWRVDTAEPFDWIHPAWAALAKPTMGGPQRGLRPMQDVAGCQGLDTKSYVIAAMRLPATGWNAEAKAKAKALVARSLEAQDPLAAQSLRGAFAHALGERGESALTRTVEPGLPEA